MRDGAPPATIGAARTELHEHATQGGVMRMRRVPSLALPPGESVDMAPGGLHLMLFELARPLRRGERFPVTLHFRDAPDVEVQVEVRGPGGESRSGSSGGDPHRHGVPGGGGKHATH